MNLTFLAVIPARGGSKGVPRKNIRELAGKPLIAWTIEEAKKSKYINKIILSSEDEEIIKVASSYGCEVPFVRPDELAQDETPGVEPILHAIRHCPGFDYIIVLQPTSPLRTVNDIDSCIEKALKTNAKSCVSISETDKSPYWMYSQVDGNLIVPIIEQNNIIARRQDTPKIYSLNGAVYLAESNWLLENKALISECTIGYEMTTLNSFDIDTELDFMIASFLKRNFPS